MLILQEHVDLHTSHMIWNANNSFLAIYQESDKAYTYHLCGALKMLLSGQAWSAGLFLLSLDFDVHNGIVFLAQELAL